MILESKIRSLVERKMHQIGGFLVDVKVSHTNDITVLIDLDDGVTFDHCTNISKYIESYFDREIEDYSLKVCSPGIDKAFVVDEQYLKNIGKDVKVLLKNGKRTSGKIISYKDSLFLEKTSKKNEVKKVIINREDIKETKLKINFK
jgi:ribosome maturation factor RimP|tara:strand:+ start:1919 stop:2356 length:438 start_codon:yes stop_codon:yes gene_type:complete